MNKPLPTSINFQRNQDRYLVLKNEDIASALSPIEKLALGQLTDKILQDRYERGYGRQPLTTVVIEEDWPEYEPTWELLEARIKSELEGPI